MIRNSPLVLLRTPLPNFEHFFFRTELTYHHKFKMMLLICAHQWYFYRQNAQQKFLVEISKISCKPI